MLIYLVRLADVSGINLFDAAREKLFGNKKKYPVDMVIGSAKKYSEYI